MKIEDVKGLTPKERFWYWIRERHSIYLRRQSGRSKPWTDDEILQSYFFTNPYRENDKVTVWFRDRVRTRLRNSPRVIFATICFRWFNLPTTGEVLIGNGSRNAPNKNGSLLLDWDPKEARRRLGRERDGGAKIFTGAFMVNSPPGIRKMEAITERINNVWEDREQLQSYFSDSRNWIGSHLSLKEAHNALTQYPGLGGFMAYEVVCDLRYTRWLENAPDRDTWCNPGPGCIRGLYRLEGEVEMFKHRSNSNSPPRPRDAMKRMVKLLAEARRKFRGFPRMEMREIEHSLCEFDKYMRLLNQDGRAKRKYNGR